jgi:hypothetical protein
MISQEELMQHNPHNPLSKYFRAPKLYIKLPSEGQFYPPNFLNTAVNGEIAVYPLTAIDQILLKTPDAILNGEAMLKVVKNCVPDVSDPKLLVEPDINVILLAIRIASSGATAEWKISCPNCNHENLFDVNLTDILATAQPVTGTSEILVNNSLRVKVRPYNFEQRNKQILNEIEESQTLKLLNANTESDENQKMAQLSEHVNKMAQRTFDVLAMSIESVTIEETGEVVTDSQYIQEFVKGISRTQADVITSSIRTLNQSGLDTVNKFKCESCAHEWSQQLDFDPTSFFD